MEGKISIMLSWVQIFQIKVSDVNYYPQISKAKESCTLHSNDSTVNHGFWDSWSTVLSSHPNYISCMGVTILCNREQHKKKEKIITTSTHEAPSTTCKISSSGNQTYVSIKWKVNQDLFILSVWIALKHHNMRVQ